MNDPTQLSIYQFRAVLNGVSPMVWRRFLLASETSLADLHEVLQLAFGWSGFYFGSAHDGLLPEWLQVRFTEPQCAAG